MHAGVPAPLPNRAVNVLAAMGNACLGLIRSTARPQKTLHPRRGCIRGSISLTTRLCTLPLSPTHCTPKTPLLHKTSRRWAHGGATAPPSHLPDTGKQETGSTQLGATARQHFQFNPHYCSLPFSPTHHPPKTPLLHLNESSSGARQRDGSAIVRA